MTFTSGTTKLPKPVMLSYYNLVNNARQFTARMHVERSRGDVLMAPLPLFHSSGMTGMLFHSLVTGVPTVLHRMFRAEQALRDIEAYHVSVLMAVPSMLELLADDPHRAHCDLSSLRVGQSSGASITPEKLLRIVQNLGFRHFLMGYGQTECSPPRHHDALRGRPCYRHRYRRSAPSPCRTPDSGSLLRSHLRRRPDRRNSGARLQHHAGLLPCRAGER